MCWHNRSKWVLFIQDWDPKPANQKKERKRAGRRDLFWQEMMSLQSVGGGGGWGERKEEVAFTPYGNNCKPYWPIFKNKKRRRRRRTFGLHADKGHNRSSSVGTHAKKLGRDTFFSSYWPKTSSVARLQTGRCQALPTYILLFVSQRDVACHPS